MSKAGFERVLAAVAIAAAPRLVTGKFRYKQLEQGLVHEIGTQANPALESRGDLKEVYDEDVEIIIKDGKYYLLHEEPASAAEDASGASQPC